MSRQRRDEVHPAALSAACAVQVFIFRAGLAEVHESGVWLETRALWRETWEMTGNLTHKNINTGEPLCERKLKFVTNLRRAKDRREKPQHPAGLSPINT